MRKLDKTTFKHTAKDDPRDRLEVIIGDDKQPDFKPQAKIQRWDNEVNLSLRLKEDIDSQGRGQPEEKDGKVSQKRGNKRVEVYEKEPSDELPEGGLEFEVVLDEKPESNELEFSIEDKGVKFYYQYPVDEKEMPRATKQTETHAFDENGNVIEEKPENIVGSYAVYMKEPKPNIKGEEKYRAGKVGHIHRPKIKDAEGNETWGRLDITDGVLTLIIPQEFLDSAVYPVKVDPTVGYETAGSSYSYDLCDASNDNLLSTYFEIPDAWKPVQLSLNFIRVDNNAPVKGCLCKYSDESLLSDTISESHMSAGSGWDNWNISGASDHPSGVYRITALGDGSSLSGTGPELAKDDAYEASDKAAVSGTGRGHDYTFHDPLQFNYYYDYKFSQYITYEVNDAPNSPTNPSPTDTATGVDPNTPLAVDVSDPDGDPMDVSFYWGEGLVTSSETEGFETDFGNWTNVTGYNDWRRNSGSTPSGSTGPSDGYLGSTYYIYVETSSGEGSNSAGDESVIEHSSFPNYTEITFSFHQYGADQGTLYLEGYDGSQWVEIWSSIGDQGDQWYQSTQFLSGYSKLRFRNVAAGGYLGDVALDAITVTSEEGSETLIETVTGVASGGRAETSALNLSENTSYDWFAEADDGLSITESQAWTFTTGVGNTAPDTPTNPSPLDGETGVPQDTTLSVDVSDPDNDTMDVEFYWDDNTLIEAFTGVSSGSTVTTSPLSLGSGTYSWYVTADDGIATTQSPTWSFTTLVSTIDSATGGSISSSFGFIYGVDSGAGSSAPTIFLSGADTAVGAPRPVVLLSEIDSGVGSDIASLLAWLTNTDSAAGISTSIVNLSSLDAALGNSSPTVLLPSTEGVQGVDQGTGNEESYKILLSMLDSAVGNSEITGLLDIADFIIRLDGLVDHEIDLEGEHDLSPRLIGLSDVMVDIEGEYTLEEILDGLRDLYEDLEGEM